MFGEQYLVESNDTYILESSVPDEWVDQQGIIAGKCYPTQWGSGYFYNSLEDKFLYYASMKASGSWQESDGYLIRLKHAWDTVQEKLDRFIASTSNAYRSEISNIVLPPFPEDTAHQVNLLSYRGHVVLIELNDSNIPSEATILNYNHSTQQVVSIPLLQQDVGMS